MCVKEKRVGINVANIFLIFVIQGPCPKQLHGPSAKETTPTPTFLTPTLRCLFSTSKSALFVFYFCISVIKVTFSFLTQTTDTHKDESATMKQIYIKAEQEQVTVLSALLFVLFLILLSSFFHVSWLHQISIQFVFMTQDAAPCLCMFYYPKCVCVCVKRKHKLEDISVEARAECHTGVSECRLHNTEGH